MESIKELADDIYRERVLRARRTPIEQKIAASGELFDGVCERMTAGLRTRIRGLMRPRSSNFSDVDSLCFADWSPGHDEQRSDNQSH